MRKTMWTEETVETLGIIVLLALTPLAMALGTPMLSPVMLNSGLGETSNVATDTMKAKSSSTGTPLTQSSSVTYQNITVDTAHDMIKRRPSADLLLLDVRTKREYDVSHLYDAINIPLENFQSRLEQVEGSKHDLLIVYCRTGYRSTLGSEILVEHNFLHVYNMIGGIQGWKEAGYPMYATSHQIITESVHGYGTLQIEPLVALSNCPCCTENQATSNEANNVSSTVITENERFKKILVTYEVDGSTKSFVITKSLLKQYRETTEEANRTLSLTHTVVTTPDSSMTYYTLTYLVRHVEYNFTLYSILTPLNADSYNTSFTVLNFAPKGKSEVSSIEFVELPSRITLSQLYQVLSKINKELRKVYKRSNADTLTPLASSYQTMAKETKYLARLVKKHVSPYNHEKDAFGDLPTRVSRVSKVTGMLGFL